LARDPKFDEISPQVGEINEDALAELADEDPDHALSMLAEMRNATDQQLAAVAARIAGRLVLEVARVGPRQARGTGTMVSSPADRFEGDLDLERSLDGLIQARATGEVVDAADLSVRHWTRPATAVTLLVDRSGSMSGRRLATAAVAAAACAYRAPVDWSVLAFADRVIAVKSQHDARSPTAVVDDLLRLRGQGTTDLAGALRAAATQLEHSRAKRRVTILMSDCRATIGAEALPVARGLDELCILAPADDDADAIEFAKSVGARIASIDGPSEIPAALLRVLDK
jgi:Mg-chelatase subunit ChlD